MARIDKNNYGKLAISKSALIKTIIKNMINMEEYLIPCNKKGKPMRKSILTGYSDFANSVEIEEHKKSIHIRVFVVSKVGEQLEPYDDQFFDAVESDFVLLGLNKPASICINVKGIQDRQIIESNINIVRENSQDAKTV